MILAMPEFENKNFFAGRKLQHKKVFTWGFFYTGRPFRLPQAPAVSGCNTSTVSLGKALQFRKDVTDGIKFQTFSS